ncbi:class I SAM-dependent methyltransferase [soil metagenome]
MNLPRVVLLPRRAKPFYARHPWVYPGAIASVEGEPEDGAIVDLVSHTGNFVARGFYNGQSKLRVRLYGWTPEATLDRSFFAERLKTAIEFRTNVLKLAGPDRACRLVFSESDGLSGLTVDQYGSWLVVQFTSRAMAQRQEMIAELLVELVGPRGIYLRTEKGIGSLEGLELQDRLLWGEAPPADLTVEENGLRFLVNLQLGQKTGFFLDQRDNRPAVARYAGGRRVLDVFCYSGAFGLFAAKHGASAVVGIDASEGALELARANSELNGFSAKTQYLKGDAFKQLQTYAETGERFDLIVLDPPKFARSRKAIDEALGGYRRLQALALRLLPKDGILVTCCCSGVITQDMLVEVLSQLGQDEKRDIQLLELRGQAADHPVALSCPETSYLKCLVSRVM